MTDNAPPGSLIETSFGEMAVGKRALIDPYHLIRMTAILFVVWVCVGSDKPLWTGPVLWGVFGCACVV